MVFKQYKWKNGSRIKADAQVVGEEIDRLRQANGGSISARQVVEAAAVDDSPLRACFEWDDARAAHEHRLQQARTVIRSVVVVVEDDEATETREVRAFVSYAPTEEADSREVYTHIRTAMETPGIRGQVIDRAWSELLAWRTRYEGLKAFADVFAAIDKVRTEAVA